LGETVLVNYMAFFRKAVHFMYNDGVRENIMESARAEVEEKVCVYM